MKKITQFKIVLLLNIVLYNQIAHPIVSSADLNANIQTWAINPTTGDFYVGTAASAGNLTLAKFSPVTGSTIPTASSIHASALGLGISNLTISPNNRIVFSTSDFIVVTDGTTYGTSTAAVTAQGAAAADVKGLAASSTNVFAILAPDGGNFTAANSIVGAWNINTTTLGTSTAATSSLRTELSVANGPFAIANTAGLGQNNGGDNPRQTIHWNNDLQRLYVGISIQAAAGANDGARSVAVYSVNNDGTGLTLLNLKTNPAASWGLGNAGLTNAANNIVGVVGAGAGPTVRTLSVLHLKTMRTSTGFYYLIICGGNGNNDATDTRVWALPLVSPGNTAATVGTLAAVNTTDGKFDTSADANASLYNGASVPAQVGVLGLPYTLTNLTIHPSDMQVVGDTVYVSSNVNTANDSEASIHYSQALFDENGKIKAWTNWEKAAPTGLGTSAADGSINGFGVNARTGKIWAIPEDSGAGNPRGVRTNNWAAATGATTIAGAVNAVLNDGCFATLSLGRSAFNFGNAATGRYTLFGGNGKVVFIRPSLTNAAAYNSIETTQTTDFSAATDFLSTTLPSTAGTVTCLGYSHWTSNASDGFFFAGTTNGLYAYVVTATNVGMTPNTPQNALNANFFVAANNSWKAVTSTNTTTVTGHVKKIRSLGQNVYVLARSNNNGTITDTLYSIAVQTDMDNFVINKIAVAGADDLSTISAIFDFEVINGVLAATDDQIILATNDGLFQSRIDGGVEAATATTTPLWSRIDNRPNNSKTDNLYFTSLYAPSTSNLITTIQGIYSADQQPHLYTYQGSSIDQFCSSADDFIGIGNYINRIPTVYNSNSTTLFSILPRINNLWTDGGRRLFVATPSDGSSNSTIFSLPFRVGSTEWNMTSNSIAPITEGDLSGKQIYQIDMMPNGHIVACTNTGIVLL